MVDVAQNQDLIIYEVQNVKLLEVPHEGNVQTVFENETLQVVQNQQQEIFIKVGNFKYQLFQETPVYLTAYEAHRSYIFPCIQANYAVLFSNHVPNYEEIYDCLDQILSSISNLVYNQGQKQQKIVSLRKSQILLKNGQSNLNPGGEDQFKMYETPNGDDIISNDNTPQGNEEVNKINGQIINDQNIQEKQMRLVNQSQQILQKQSSQQEENKKSPQKSNSIANIIGFGGTIISKGIKVGADVVHTGIQKTGSFVEKQVNKNDKEIKVSDSTKSALKLIKTFSGKVIEITSYAASQIIKASIKLSSMAFSAISKKIDEGSVKSQNESIQYLRQIASASIQATSNILDNLDEAADKIGLQINESITQVVQKKYGDDAAELVNDGVQVALNVNGAYKNVKKISISNVAAKAAKETIKQVV